MLLDLIILTISQFMLCELINYNKDSLSSVNTGQSTNKEVAPFVLHLFREQPGSVELQVEGVGGQ